MIADADDVDLVRALFREYDDSLGVDLSFQGFDEELAVVPPQPDHGSRFLELDLTRV